MSPGTAIAIDLALTILVCIVAANVIGLIVAALVGVLITRHSRVSARALDRRIHLDSDLAPDRLMAELLERVARTHRRTGLLVAATDPPGLMIWPSQDEKPDWSIQVAIEAHGSGARATAWVQPSRQAQSWLRRPRLALRTFDELTAAGDPTAADQLSPTSAPASA
ncbi:hypothetical protein GCM10027515_18920 [Schumannella luteola]|uniref:Uncharacterized protein n=1 Tax=Schumannella luteola TaxID=472059 RepID=A0A852YEX5_9MICO|nr:hypothetical protein [Schumannella luteola]NYH00313.1 hypothetical protein [Schumannella luteola]TPX05999.1 hypothetical protein FJ656_03820 [Schumannella luteola]